MSTSIVTPEVSTERPRDLQVWLAALRPKTLAAGAAPVIVGISVAAAQGAVSPSLCALCLLGALALQLVSNLANDLFDHLNGADTEDRLGPERATAKGWVSVRQMAWATGAMSAIAVAIGALLIAEAGWPIAVIGIASLASAIAYTAGPRPLGYLGLGDLMVFVFFGPVAVCGTVFVLRGDVGFEAWLAAIPMGLLSTAILVVNNLRDRDEDARTGKRTLAVRLGANGARLEYLSLIASSYALMAFGVLRGSPDIGLGWLLPMVTLPFALLRVRAIQRKTGAALNQELGATAGLLTAFAVCLAAGVHL
jgi:1,4-dihydroxy-2-naphthoate polyprenyltransferase